MTNSSNQPVQHSIYLTIPEAAEQIRVSQRTLYRWMREGRLKCFRVGNITRIAASDMEDFIRSYTHEGDSHGQHPRHAPES